MEGNIVGEQFDDFVAKQVGIRQSNQFGGYNTSRTNDQLQYLNNRNAWVKLASSVDVLEGDIITPFTASSGGSGGSGAGGSGGGFTPSGGYTPGGGFTPSGNFGNTGGGSTITIPSGPIPGLSNVTNYKNQKLRDIGIPESQVGDYSGNKFAAKAILFNTLSSFDLNSKSYSPRRAGVSNTTDLWNNFAYGLGGTNYGIQPPPGIVSVQVDSLNRGSIRKANVTLKAHNRFQFDIIELLYLRLGFTMMLEWGWDRYLNNATGAITPVGNTIIEDIWFTAKDTSQLDMLKNIQKMRETYNGNYDGFFGKVSNFTWNFNPDGSYDITIDLITVGDVIESIKANTYAKGTFKAATSNETELKTEATTVSLSPDNIILKAAAVSSIGEYLYSKIKELNTSGIITPSLPNPSTRKLDPNGIVEYYEISTTANSKSVGSQYYVRLGEFLAQLEGLIVPRVENGNSKTFDYLVIPRSEGEYVLKDLDFSYFNLESKKSI
jgi:hypothetical protein